MNRAVMQAVGVAAALVVIAAGFFFGRSLHDGTETGFAFDYDQPAYEVTGFRPAQSNGGFTGFGETAGLTGVTHLSGKVVAVSETEVTIEATNGARTTLRLAEPRSLTRIEASDRASLRPGVTAIVLHSAGSDEATAVLIVERP